MVTTVTTTTYFTNNWTIRRQVPLSRAMSLMEHDRAIIPPDAGLLEVHAPSQVVLVPDHIIFTLNRAFVPHPPLPTRAAVYARDQGRCAYCGVSLPLSAATLDHVVPQSQGGRSTWENLVTCCRRCNQRKGGRTPAEARMPLRVQPGPPRVRLRPD